MKCDGTYPHTFDGRNCFCQIKTETVERKTGEAQLNAYAALVRQSYAQDKSANTSKRSRTTVAFVRAVKETKCLLQSICQFVFVLLVFIWREA